MSTSARDQLTRSTVRARPVSLRHAAPAGTLAAILLLAVSCGLPGRTGRPPDLLLITIDTLRADRLGCYGDPHARTTTLDALAEMGVRFSRASAVAPITLPTHASIMTGRYPSAHGVRINSTFVLPDRESTLAETLGESGYRCGAAVGAFVLAYRFGLGQGFEHYDDRFEAGGIAPPPGLGPETSPSERRAAAVTDAALSWLGDQPASDPVFLWVHYFDPHADYDPPPPYASTSVDRYRGEIAYTDREIGRLLEGLRRKGRLDDTLIVVVADHGEAFGEHGETQHGLFVYEPTIQVPLLFSWPGRIPQGVVVDHEVSQVDLLPTILSLLNLDLPNGVQGQDLSPAILGNGPLEDRPGVMVENLLPRLDFGWSQLYALRDEGWKFIEAPRPELYHLESDPNEERNLAGEEPRRVARARALIQEIRGGAALDPEHQEAKWQDPEVVARLRSLGYMVVSSPTEPQARTAMPDPKDRIEEYLACKRANTLLFRGRPREAIRVMEGILQQNPDNAFIHLLLGEALVSDGDHERGERVYRDILEREPENCIALMRVGAIEAVNRKNLARAAELYRESLECNPNQPNLWARLSALEADSKNLEKALAHLKRAVDLDPGNGSFHRKAAELYSEVGDLEASRRHWQALLDLSTPSAEVMNALGLIEARRGETEAAEAWFRKALEIDEENPVAHANLGTLLLRRGGYRESVEYLRVALEQDASLSQARFNLALALIRLDELDAAREELSRYAEDRPGDARGWIRLARAFEARGSDESAQEAWREVLRADPSNELARSALKAYDDGSVER